jgi:hypothetical protein
MAPASKDHINPPGLPNLGNILAIPTRLPIPAVNENTEPNEVKSEANQDCIIIHYAYDRGARLFLDTCYLTTDCRTGYLTPHFLPIWEGDNEEDRGTELSSRIQEITNPGERKEVVIDSVLVSLEEELYGQFLMAKEHLISAGFSLLDEDVGEHVYARDNEIVLLTPYDWDRKPYISMTSIFVKDGLEARRHYVPCNENFAKNFAEELKNIKDSPFFPPDLQKRLDFLERNPSFLNRTKERINRGYFDFDTSLADYLKPKGFEKIYAEEQLSEDDSFSQKRKLYAHPRGFFLAVLDQGETPIIELSYALSENGQGRHMEDVFTARNSRDVFERIKKFIHDITEIDAQCPFIFSRGDREPASVTAQFNIQSEPDDDGEDTHRLNLARDLLQKVDMKTTPRWFQSMTGYKEKSRLAWLPRFSGF